jgi:hypothetical protein
MGMTGEMGCEFVCHPLAPVDPRPDGGSSIEDDDAIGQPQGLLDGCGKEEYGPAFFFPTGEDFGKLRDARNVQTLARIGEKEEGAGLREFAGEHEALPISS